MDLICFHGTRPLPDLQEAVQELCRRVSKRRHWFAGHYTKVFVSHDEAPAVAAELVRLTLEAVERLNREAAR